MAFFDLLILPLSLFPVGQASYPLFYFIINGVPLDQKFLEIVAQQPLNLSEVSKLRRKHRIKLFVSGIETALLSAAPLVSMIAPIVTTAFLIHILHGFKKCYLVPSDERT